MAAGEIDRFVDHCCGRGAKLSELSYLAAADVAKANAAKPTLALIAVANFSARRHK
jgi:hypothetical protein